MTLALPTPRIVYGYVRESNADNSTPEAQEYHLRQMAERFGFDPAAVTIVVDWGISGARTDRPGWLRIQADAEADRVEAVLAVSTDRLGRDVEDYMRVEAILFLHGVRIITGNEGERRANRSVIERYLQPLMAQQYHEDAVQRGLRAKATRARRREAHRAECTQGAFCTERAHWDGRMPYGVTDDDDPQVVIDAFLQRGSYNATAVLLNEMNFPPPGRGVKGWEAITVQRIIERVERLSRERLEGMRLPRSRTRRRGVPTLATHTFARLVRCPHDNRVLTATYRADRAGKRTGYFCRLGRTTSTHPKPYSISERALMEFAVPAADAVLGLVADDSAYDPRAVEALEEQRRNVGRAVAHGLPDSEADEMLASINAELARWEAVRTSGETWSIGIDWGFGATLPPDWDWTQATDPEVLRSLRETTPAEERRRASAVNARLRDVMSRIILSPETFQPVGIVWLRQPDDPRAERWEDGWYLPFLTSARAVPQGRNALDRALVKPPMLAPSPTAGDPKPAAEYAYA